MPFINYFLDGNYSTYYTVEIKVKTVVSLFIHDLIYFINGLFYVDQEALRGSIEAKLAVSPLYLSSIGSLSFPFLSTHHCFGVFYMIRTIRSFPTHRPCISVYISSFQRWSQFSVSIPCFRARFTA